MLYLSLLPYEKYTEFTGTKSTVMNLRYMKVLAAAKMCTCPEPFSILRKYHLNQNIVIEIWTTTVSAPDQALLQRIIASSTSAWVKATHLYMQALSSGRASRQVQILILTYLGNMSLNVLILIHFCLITRYLKLHRHINTFVPQEAQFIDPILHSGGLALPIGKTVIWKLGDDPTEVASLEDAISNGTFKAIHAFPSKRVACSPRIFKPHSFLSKPYHISLSLPCTNTVNRNVRCDSLWLDFLRREGSGGDHTKLVIYPNLFTCYAMAIALEVAGMMAKILMQQIYFSSTDLETM